MLLKCQIGYSALVRGTGTSESPRALGEYEGHEWTLRKWFFHYIGLYIASSLAGITGLAMDPLVLANPLG